MMVYKTRRWNKIMKRAREDTKEDILLEIRETEKRQSLGEKSRWGSQKTSEDTLSGSEE